MSAELLRLFDDDVACFAKLQAIGRNVNTHETVSLPSLVVFFTDKSIVIMPPANLQSMTAFDLDDPEERSNIMRALAHDENVETLAKLAASRLGDDAL
jgi:hypothetical protein